jgi:ubiquinone/menaquinone biosynthesis C-methylase UbiE
MARPVIKKDKKSFKDYLIQSHQKLSHNNRISVISRVLIEKINSLNIVGKQLKCIDIGCGDMQIAKILCAKYNNTFWDCIDMYTLPESIKMDEKRIKYQVFDGKVIPFESKKFEVALLIDVLHHAENIGFLLKETARVSNFIIVKDHYEYSFFSRNALKAMDLYGNWAYGIKVPGKYFTKESFAEACSIANLKIVQLEIGLDLYEHLPLLNRILKPRWQFIAVLSPLE